MKRAGVLGLGLVLVAGCAGGAVGPPRARDVAPQLRGPASPADATATRERVRPPAEAFLAGFMPLEPTGVPAFHRARPTYDGRGVVIAILDSGIDPAAPGLIETSTGAPKLLDVRDFSGEGHIALRPVDPDDAGGLVVEGHRLSGAGRLRRLTTSTAWYGGVFRELVLGSAPAADVNGNGTNTDVFPVVVIKATDGWAAFLDTNRNGSLDDEAPLHDYRQGRETLSLGTRPITLAANFGDVDGRPTLDLYFDTSGHGTHVAGIAAGYNLYDVAGFHGVAPGAQLIGLKIANNARGGLTTHGSIARAMEYAAAYARVRGLPLVLNLSFGVGNEREGHAVIDSLVNEFLIANPDVVFTISAGNDGPGLSTMGFPASADLALTVGATFPGTFAAALDDRDAPAVERVGWWSARGGDVGKPDVVAPGIAYSTVPPWNTGDEVKAGTSMAAPHVAGLAACLRSAMVQERRPVSGVDLAQALIATARPLPGATIVDQGAGVPSLPAAYAWLVGGHHGSGYRVRAASGASAAWHAGRRDTVETFVITHATGRRAAQYTLHSDAPWLHAPATVTAAPGRTEVAVRIAGAGLDPGVHVGAVHAFNPTDTLAGPLFRLVGVVVVPHDLAQQPLVDRRRIAAGTVQRYFLDARAPRATAIVTVTLPDSSAESAVVRLYEPGGRPFRDGDELALGDDDPGTGRLVVRAEDLVPGLYELVIAASPLAGVTAAVRAELSPAALAFTAEGVEVGNATPARLTGRARSELIGATRPYVVQGRGAPAESLTVRVPAWAAQAEIDVLLPLDRWEQFTDFGLTVFDDAGQIVKKTPLNHAVVRQRFDVTGRRGQRLHVELFPAYAWIGRTPAWAARVHVRFLMETPRQWGDARDVAVVPGGRVRVPLSAATALEVPDGFVPLYRTSLGPALGRGALAASR